MKLSSSLRIFLHDERLSISDAKRVNLGITKPYHIENDVCRNMTYRHETNILHFISSR